MEGFFDGYENAVDFLKEKAAKNIEKCYNYCLSAKLDSSKFRRIYFPDGPMDLTKKFLYCLSWLSAHFDSEKDQSFLFSKVDSSLNNKKDQIAEKAPSSLPSVQFSGL